MLCLCYHHEIKFKKQLSFLLAEGRRESQRDEWQRFKAWSKIWYDLACRSRRQWHPTPVLLPGKSHGWRSLVGCSPWGRERVGHDWATSLSLFTFMHWRRKWQSLQCSCLENPRDGGAWWVAIYGVAQSQTRLKWLSSSSIHINMVIKWTESMATSLWTFSFGAHPHGKSYCSQKIY